VLVEHDDRDVMLADCVCEVGRLTSLPWC
jgi:hypothetical protein